MKNRFRAGRVVCVSLLFVGLFIGSSARVLALQTAWFAWEPSSFPDVVNYNIYYWQPGGSVTNKLATGGVTTAGVSGLVEGATYCFVLTASTQAGLESAPSDQILNTVPSPATLQVRFVPGANGGAAALSITAIGDIPEQWALECSLDLLNWATYASGTNPAVNILVQDVTAPQKFFRLKGL